MGEKTNQSDVEKTKSFGEVLNDSFKELGETFRAFFKAPKALWGINVPYVLEGLVYLWFNCDDHYAWTCAS